MTLMHRLVPAVLGAFLLVAAPAASVWPGPVGVAADADLIAVYSQDLERRLLRVRFDRAAGKVAITPFGPPGVERFAVAPRGAFVVYAGRHGSDGNEAPHLFLLDEGGQPLGKPLPSPIGAVGTLAVSPRGDWVAAAGGGWIAMLAVEGAGAARRLVTRAVFGVSPHRAVTYAFRPEGGLVTLTDDWLLTFRANDGSVQRTLDLKTVNRDLVASSSPADNLLFKLTWSPRGDRFAVSAGGGPFWTTIFDRAGRRLQPRDESHDLTSTDVAFIAGGDAMIVYGMAAPVVLQMRPLTTEPFGDDTAAALQLVPLAGGRTIALLTSSEAALWSDSGKRLVAPAGLENYEFRTAAAGADDELIVAAERGGWVDLFTREGKFVRRVQSGARGESGQVALSADGSVVAAYGWAQLGIVTPTGGRLWGGAYPSDGAQDFFVAVAADGSRVAAAGPANALRSWSRDGTNATSFSLKADGQQPDRLMGLAVSTGGDVIALADEKSAVWLAWPADQRVLRVALTAGAHSVAALPGAGFAVGLADGTVVRVGRDGGFVGAPLKGAEQGAAGRIVVAPDGQSLIVIDGDEISARHLAWDGKVLSRPIRVSRLDQIKDALFQGGVPVLITVWRSSDPTARNVVRLVGFAEPATGRWRQFEQPPP